jgi:hypothetical protein
MSDVSAPRRWNADRRGIRLCANDRPMPTFFFHVRDGIRVRAAERGQALAGRRFEIADEGGRVQATVAIKDVLASR